MKTFGGSQRCVYVLLSIIAGLTFLPTAYGLDPHRAISQYVQTSWTNESGLPQNSVHSIAQTSNGFLWLGTEEGLVRFDGTAFEVYNRRLVRGLPSDYIGALLADHDGSLWIGTDSGLTHYTGFATSGTATGGLGQEGTFVSFAARDGLAGDIVTSLAQTADGALWVGTNRGLNRIKNGKIEAWKKKDGLADDEVQALATDLKGALWIGTTRGLSQFDGAHFRNWTASDGFPAGSISAIALDSDGSIWAAPRSYGLVQIRDGRVFKILQLKGRLRQVNALLHDRDGTLWLAFDRRGLGRIVQNRLSLYDAAHGLPSNRSTRALFADREGNIWAGLLDAGVVQFRDGKFATFGKPEGLAGNYIGNILQDHDGSMWIGSDSNGLNHLLANGRVEIWDHLKGIPDQAIFSIAQSRNGTLWTGFRNGFLARIRNGNVTTFDDPQAPETSLNALMEDRTGNLWVGFYGKGVARFDGRKFHHVTTNGRISEIVQSIDGTIWAASDGDGVERIDQDHVTYLTAVNGLPNNHVMCIFADRDGDLWVGTASGGLSRIHSGKITTWTPEQGLHEATVGSIVEDDLGYLWLAGDSGIYRISKQELETVTAGAIHPQAFGTADGLRSRETVYGGMPSTWKDRSGKLWFSTIRGAAVIDPAAIHINATAPPVWIEGVKFNSKSIFGKEGMQLGRGPANLEFSFAAPTFVAPQLESFQYQLIGFDKGWISAGARRSAWYTNLPPGQYTFSVRARNSDGVWNETGASFSFVLLPPISQTPLAFFLYALLVAMVVWLVIRIRTESLVRRQQELKRLVAEKTAQLQAEKSALDAAREELHSRATYDSLTGLLNRPTILERLKHEIERALRDQVSIGVAILDLDHFKLVNDTYGHLCGDVVIAETAERIRHAIRSYDMAGRFGGEEFLIVMPGWSSDSAHDRMNDLLEAIRKQPFRYEEEELNITCSIGVTTFQPEADLPDVLRILKAADDALYVSKEFGRDRLTIYEACPVIG
jgi:diguanylate cyclase (GGDEF)-like protein